MSLNRIIFIRYRNKPLAECELHELEAALKAFDESMTVRYYPDVIQYIHHLIRTLRHTEK